MRRSRVLSIVAPFALACLVILPSPSRAAGGAGSVELGLDGSLSLRSFDSTYKGSIPADVDNVFSVSLPVSQVRVGIYSTDAVEIEPTLGFSLVSQGGDSAHDIHLGVSLLYNFHGSEGGVAPFVSIGVGLHSVDFGSGSASQALAGGGVGMKAALGDRSAFRLQASFARNFENDDFLGSWDLGLAFGYSFFTR